MHRRTSTDSIRWPEKSQHASSHIDRFDSPVDVRYLVFVSLGSKNHNMHHRTSTDSIRQSMCDIGFLYHVGNNSHAGLVETLRRFIHTQKYVLFVKWPTQSDVAISRKCCFPHGFCILLARKSQHASSHIDRFDSPVDVRYLLARKITPCIIAHRPIRFASRCAISGFVFSWLENHNMHHRTSTSRRQLIPVFDTNLPFHDFPNYFNHDSWFTVLGKS